MILAKSEVLQTKHFPSYRPAEDVAKSDVTTAFVTPEARLGEGHGPCAGLMDDNGTAPLAVPAVGFAAPCDQGESTHSRQAVPEPGDGTSWIEARLVLVPVAGRCLAR